MYTIVNLDGSMQQVTFLVVLLSVVVALASATGGFFLFLCFVSLTEKCTRHALCIVSLFVVKQELFQDFGERLCYH